MQVTWESIALVAGAFGGPTIFLATFGKGFFVEYVAPRVKIEIQNFLKSTDFLDAEKIAVKKCIEEETRRSDGVIGAEIEKRITQVATDHNNRLERALVDINRSISDNVRAIEGISNKQDSWGHEIDKVSGGIDVLLKLNGVKSDHD